MFGFVAKTTECHFKLQVMTSSIKAMYPKPIRYNSGNPEEYIKVTSENCGSYWAVIGSSNPSLETRVISETYPLLQVKKPAMIVETPVLESWQECSYGFKISVFIVL